MRHYRNHFKCKCMTFYSQRMTGIDVMSGTWKVHMSLTQLIHPRGLHRTYYRVKTEKLTEDWDEDCFEKIIYRYNREAQRVCK